MPSLPTFFLPPFFRDSRGNRLEKWEAKRVRGCDHSRVYLCGPAEVAHQVTSLLQPTGAREIRLEGEQAREWTHRIHVDGPIPDDGRRTIDLLTRVLTITDRQPVDIALALGFYKDPEQLPNGEIVWKDTPAGSMVHAAKYWMNQQAFEDLVRALARVIDEHKTYRGADFIAAVPGHDTTKRSFGETLAEGVAQTVGKPLVRPTAARAVRPQRKTQDEADQPITLEGEFTFGAEVAGRVVVVIDDVYRSGDTMVAMATAAKAAGAVAVLGLVGARTRQK